VKSLRLVTLILFAAMIEAGSETTSASLNSAIKYLAAFPQAQQAARDELARVVGDERSPTFADEQDLPYIRAIGKEIFRIRPPTTIGSPHFTTADVVYKDIFIPKGTVVSLFQYAIHLDESKWNDPETFDPSRYLTYPLKAGAYAGLGDADQRDHFSFGAGRRICPGMHVAENSLFITIAKLLWAFEILPPLGEDGSEIPVDVSDESYEEGGDTVPKPFKVRFVLVNEERGKTLRREWDEAKAKGVEIVVE
jgi:cytochrome P450